MSDFDNLEKLGPQWYVAHTYSGYENKVKLNLEKIVANRELQDKFFDIRVPVETIVESDGTKEREVESKIFPSYVLINMIMSDETWHIVRNITGVTGFVGPGSKPAPLSREEVASIIKDEQQVTVKNAVAIGDLVEIYQGPFEGYSGKLAEISEDGAKVSVVITMAGRDMTLVVDMIDVRLKKEN